MSSGLRGCALCALALLAACGSSSSSGASPQKTGAPAVQTFDPDVPTWRGGCFLAGRPSKIVNASPSPDVRAFGHACDPSPGPGGLVYLDRYDPVSGTGDVTVLSSAKGAAPVVIGARGGAGGIVNGSTGARFDVPQERVLTLEDVTFVTGRLVVAPLPKGAPATAIADRVRVENYDFVAGGGVLYVGNYDATSRKGDLYFWSAGGSGPVLVAAQASRFDFVMYRLSPGRDKVAYLTGFTEAGGGELHVQPLPPGAGAALLASGAYRMTWTADGHLVYRVRNSDGITFSLWTWDGTSSVELSTSVNTASVAGNDIVYATGWDILSQQATLHVATPFGGDLLAGASPASLAFTLAAAPPGAGALEGALAYVLRGAADPFTGDLFVAPLSTASAAATHVETAVDAGAGFGFSPSLGFVAYARGFENPTSPGGTTPQPGIASELKVAAVGATPAPFVLATSASVQRVAWDPLERWVAGLASFDPASNRGTLAVRSTAGGPDLLAGALQRVGGSSFDFGDGQALAAIREWDDALGRGELVLVPTSGAAQWLPSAIGTDVTFFLQPTGGRIIYGVRGGGRDGLWLGGAP
jgi:hypothetical protein